MTAPLTSESTGQDTAGAEAEVSCPSDEAGDGAHGGEGTVAVRDAATGPGQDADLFGDQAAAQARGSVSASANRSRAARGAAAGHGKPGHTAASVTLDPARIEAALVAALQSPAVEDALVELLARTMTTALRRAGSGEGRPVPGSLPRPPAARRVLLAGFVETQQKALMDALGASFEVRTWTPTHGPQRFQTLARLCRTVVFPKDVDDDAEAGLRDMDVRVIRHAGNASRLIERLTATGS